MKKIILMLVAVFLLFEVLYFNSGVDSYELIAYNNDLVYKIESTEDVEEEIRSRYSSNVLLGEDDLYLMCDTITIEEIKNNYTVKVNE